jgi:hypothetical protein
MKKFVQVLVVLSLIVGASALAQEFNWKAQEGAELKLLLNQHPYQQALVSELPQFEALTGIKVTYDVFPEQNYFDKVTIDLSAGESSTYDVFMTGAYMIWQYAPAGWMEPLEPFINDPSKTNADYDFEDIFPDLRNSERWNLEARQNPSTYAYFPDDDCACDWHAYLESHDAAQRRDSQSYFECCRFTVFTMGRVATNCTDVSGAGRRVDVHAVCCAYFIGRLTFISTRAV